MTLVIIFQFLGVIKTKFPKCKQTPTIKRVISDHKQGKFTNDLAKNLSRLKLDLKNPENTLTEMIKIISESVNNIFPLRKLSRKEKKRSDNPWMTPGLIQSSKERKKLYLASLKKMMRKVKKNIEFLKTSTII